MNILTVGGVQYTFAKLDAALYDRFARWAATQLPDPVDELLATAARLPESMREKFIEARIDAAVERARLRGAINDPDFIAFQQTVPAVRRLFWLLLSPAHPGLTEDQAFAIVTQAQEEHGPEVFEQVFNATRAPVTEEQVEAAYFRSPGTSRAGQTV